MVQLSKIKSDVAEVIRYSQNIPEPQVDELIDTWYNAKTPMIKSFLHGETQYRYPKKVIFNLNDGAKQERYHSFIEYVANLLDNLGGWDHRLVRFLQSIEVQEFYANCLDRDYMVSSDKKIQKGTKVIRSFKFFITDERLLNDIQSKASELIQENKVEGYLVFSVHPLDFLSSSENAFNWRSCHSLDGEYRTGNLSYMCDSSTMICYLMTEHEVKLPHFPESIPWNNKKWRMLLHFNSNYDVVFAGRQYPFTSPGALEKIREVMVSHVLPPPPAWAEKNRGWTHWHNDTISNMTYAEYGEADSPDITEDTYVMIQHGIWSIGKIVKDADNAKHFNDLLRSSCYLKPYYMYAKSWFAPKSMAFRIGAEIKCLRCGEKTIDGFDSMMCPDCECQYGNSDSDEYRVCDCCGIRFYDRNGHWVGDDNYVCANCFETHCFTCEQCGETFYNSDKVWDEDNQQFVCSCCYEMNKGE